MFQEKNIYVGILLDKHNYYMIEKFSNVSEVYPVNLKRLNLFLELWKIISIIKKNNIDTIFIHSGKDAILAIILKKLLGIKIIFFKHNIMKAKTDIYHKWIIANVDKFICVSKLAYEYQTKGLIASDKKKFCTIYNGINSRRFTTDCKLCISSIAYKNTFSIGYAGRLVKNKGIFELVKAIKILLDDNINVVLFIAGDKNTPLYDEIKEYIIANNLQDRVWFQGLLDEMKSFYKNLDLFVLPSQVKEAFGLSICEAMYCKVPVLTTKSGAQVEIIKNGYNGFIIEDNSSENIAEAIKNIMKKASLNEIINNGYHTIIDKFLIENTCDKLISVLMNNTEG